MLIFYQFGIIVVGAGETEVGVIMIKDAVHIFHYRAANIIWSMVSTSKATVNDARYKVKVKVIKGP